MERPEKPPSDASATEIMEYMDAVDAWHSSRMAETIKGDTESSDD